jgi:hypothetical protein
METVHNPSFAEMKQAADSSLIVCLDIVEQENQPLVPRQLRNCRLHVDSLYVAVNGSVQCFSRCLKHRVGTSDIDRDQVVNLHYERLIDLFCVNAASQHESTQKSS